MLTKSGSLVAALCLLSAPPAQAAKVAVQGGELLVNSGAGYRAVIDAAEVKPGGAVLARPRASGSIVYEDGCTVKVEPGTVLWVAPRSPCADTGRAAADRDPDPRLAATKAFDPSWLIDGAALLGIGKKPAGP